MVLPSLSIFATILSLISVGRLASPRKKSGLPPWFVSVKIVPVCESVNSAVTLGFADSGAISTRGHHEHYLHTLTDPGADDRRRHSGQAGFYPWHTITAHAAARWPVDHPRHRCGHLERTVRSQPTAARSGGGLGTAERRADHRRRLDH